MNSVLGRRRRYVPLFEAVENGLRTTYGGLLFKNMPKYRRKGSCYSSSEVYELKITFNGVTVRTEIRMNFVRKKKGEEVISI